MIAKKESINLEEICHTFYVHLCHGRESLEWIAIEKAKTFEGMYKRLTPKMRQKLRVPMNLEEW